MPRQMNEFLRKLGYLPSLGIAPSIQEQQRRLDTIIIGVHSSSTDLLDKIDKLEKLVRTKSEKR